MKKKSEGMKTLTLFKVSVWVDDGWDVGSVEHLVLASNRERATELAVKYWKNKDDTNIVIPEWTQEIGNFTEGVIS